MKTRYSAVLLLSDRRRGLVFAYNCNKYLVMGPHTHTGMRLTHSAPADIAAPLIPRASRQPSRERAIAVYLLIDLMTASKRAPPLEAGRCRRPALRSLRPCLRPCLRACLRACLLRLLLSFGKDCGQVEESLSDQSLAVLLTEEPLRRSGKIVRGEQARRRAGEMRGEIGRRWRRGAPPASPEPGPSRSDSPSTRAVSSAPGPRWERAR